MNGLALFAGAGGLELGIKGIFPQSRIICYVEGEAYAASILVSKMEKGILHEAPIWSDVKTFNGSMFSGKVDFISAGFPCQPWSNAGKLQKTEDERWLWDDIERIICETGPSFVFLENVPGLINGGIDPVLRSLAQLGFNAEWGCLKVSEVGGNHHRNRLFIFAYNTERRCNFSNSNGNGFNSRREINENCRKRISLERGVERDKSPGMCQIISDSNPGRFQRSSLSDFKRQEISNFNRKNGNVSNSNGKRSGKGWKIRKGSNGELSFSLSKSWGTISKTNGKRLERRKEIGNPGKSGKESYQFDSRLSDIFRAEWWETEPRVGRVAHGVANRVDRLRACGNGVVPYQAYNAYSELIKRANENIKNGGK